MSMQKIFGIVIKLSKGCSNIPYLIFAYNCIIFCRTTKTAAYNVRHILDHYYKVSSKLVNLRKSKIQFSKGMSDADIKEIEQILQIKSSY